jgi:tetratricopeptide (TPR) repeat protein
MTGVFISSIISAYGTKSYVLSLDIAAKKDLPRTIGFIIVIALCLIGAITYIRTTISQIYAQSTIALDASIQQATTSAAALQSLATANNLISSSLKWDTTDAGERGLAIVKLLQFQAYLSSFSATTTLTAEQSTQAVSYITDGFKAANAAIALDPYNYVNYITQAQLAASVIPFGTPKAYETASQAYRNAITLDPLNPLVYFSAARFESGQHHDDIAVQYLTAAIQLKGNYTDAITLLGILYYQNKMYDTASVAFERVAAINPNYIGIHYYHALALAQLGKTADALTELNAALQADPNNTTIANTIASLKAGRDVPAPIMTPDTSTSLPKIKKPTTSK